MRSPPSTVLLDLDGTLVDSRPGIEASLHAALAALGHQPDSSLDLTFAIGPPIADALAVLLRRYGDDRVADGVAAYREHYGRAGMLATAVYPGIPAALDQLREAGMQLFIATSKRTVFARAILERLDLVGALHGIYGSEPDGALDHKPELLAHLLASEGIEPGKAVMVGDRRFDISGAHANGVEALGALWGYGSREELEEAGADALAKDPNELVPLLMPIRR